MCKHTNDRFIYTGHPPYQGQLFSITVPLEFARVSSCDIYEVSKSIKSDLEYSRYQNIKMADERNPAERVRRLVQYAGQVEVDNSIAPKKYFRSGVEMERMVRIICQVMGYEMDCIDVCCNNFFYQQSHLGVLCGCFFFIMHHSLCIYFSSKRISLVWLIANNNSFRFFFLIGRQILRSKALQ